MYCIGTILIVETGSWGFHGPILRLGDNKNPSYYRFLHFSIIRGILMCVGDNKKSPYYRILRFSIIAGTLFISQRGFCYEYHGFSVWACNNLAQRI